MPSSDPPISAKALTFAAYASFVPIGIATVLLGPMLPTLSARWSLNYSQAGALFTAQYLASTLAVALSGVLVSRWGFRFAIKAGLLLMSAGVALLLAGPRTMGILCIGAYGGGLGLAVPAANLLVYESGSVAHLDADYLFRQSGRGAVSRGLDRDRRQCGVVHLVPAGGGSYPEFVSLLLALRGRACARSGAGERLLILCCVRGVGLRDGGVAATSIQEDLPVRSRAGCGVSGDSTLHQLRLAGFLAEVPEISAGMDTPVAIVLVSGTLPVIAGSRGSRSVGARAFGSAGLRGGDRDCILRLRRRIPAAFHSHCGDDRRPVHRTRDEKVAVGRVVRPLGAAHSVPKGRFSFCVEDLVPQRIASPGFGRDRRPGPGSRVPGAAEGPRKRRASRKGDGIGRW